MSVKSHLSSNNTLASARQVTSNEVKTDAKYDTSNFRPASLSNCFSKVYKSIIKCRLVNSMYNNISPFISAYRKNYKTQHVMIRLLEEWKENLDKNYVVGGVLMDLSKAFDCVPHDLLLAKLAAYGVDKSFLCYIYSFLLNRKQCVRINNVNSDFQL